MSENSLYDKKSLLTLTIKKVDWREIVKDVVSFSNAEGEEYHDRLAVVAERGIVPNLDDGILKKHALYGDIVTKLK